MKTIIIASAMLAALAAPAIAQTGSSTRSTGSMSSDSGRMDKNICAEADRRADGACGTGAIRTRTGEGGTVDVRPGATPPDLSGSVGDNAGAAVGASSGSGSVSGGTDGSVPSNAP